MEVYLVEAKKQCGVSSPAQPCRGAHLCAQGCGVLVHISATSLQACQLATQHMRQEGTAPPHMRGLYGPSQHVLHNTEEQVTNVPSTHHIWPTCCLITDSGPCSPLSLQENHAALPCMPTYYYIMQWALLSPLPLKRGQGALACMPTAVCGRHGCSSYCSLAA